MSRPLNDPATNKAKRRLHDMRGRAAGNDHQNLATRGDAPTFPRLNATDVQIPKWMSPKQVEAYKYMLHSVALMDIASVSDRTALEMLCDQYMSYLDLNEKIAEDGLMITVTDSKGRQTIKIHPLLGERGRAFTNLRGLLVEFGMTPNSRRAIMKRDGNTTGDVKEDAEWDDLLN